MHALKRFGTAFGGYKMMENYPVPECGPDDIILEIKAAAICGADMKHWGVDNGYDDTNITPDQQQSVRGHEFAGEIVKVGENVKDWHIGQRVVSDNSAHVCGVCPACEQGDFLCCEHKVNLGLDNNTWGGGFSKYCKVPGEPNSRSGRCSIRYRSSRTLLSTGCKAYGCRKHRNGWS